MSSPMAVFKNANSRCALRVSETKERVTYVGVTEDQGTLAIDVHTMDSKLFYRDYKELEGYPVSRAIQHFRSPLTPAITVTSRALAHLKGTTLMNTNSANVANTSAAERNVNGTAKSSVKTGSTPKVAPVKAREATKDEQAAAKAKQKAADAAAAKTAKDKAAKDKADAAAKAAAAKGKAAPAAVKAAKQAKKQAAAKPAKKVPAKKVAKLVRGKATPPASAKTAEKPAKKAAGKAAKPAKLKGAGGRGFEENQTIKILVEENPKRAGSAAHDIFKLLMKSKTVGEFYKKGGGAHNLRFNVDKGYISVK